MPYRDSAWPIEGDEVGFAYPLRKAVILVVDLVESVRLMQMFERGVISRWRDFGDFVDDALLNSYEGRRVKNMGDGLMIEFGTAAHGVQAAAAMHEWWTRCEPLPDGTCLRIRAGLHASDVFDATTDIYGAGVNLVARIATLANPGETVASVEIKDLLVDGLDASIVDMGDCHLKHINAPVRVYRVEAPRGHEAGVPRQDGEAVPLFASVAVIPFSNILVTSLTDGLGDLISDGLIGQLSLSRDLRVVSRLSTANFRDRTIPLSETAARLQVQYVVSGTYAVSGRSITISAELTDVQSGHVVGTKRVVGAWKSLLSIKSPLTHELSEAVHATLLETSVAKALVKPIPALPSYELFLGAITLMHRANAEAFDRSRRMLEALVERHPRIALPRAWLAKWYVLRSSQGAPGDFRWAASEALELTHRALDMEPCSALALAIEGFVYCHLKKDLSTAQARLEQACSANPSESLAWLFLSITHAFQGNGSPALSAARMALSLSPMDPLRYYYESLMGSCEFAASHFDEAVRWCEMSRLRNCQHLSTLRVLIAAHVAAGRVAAASAVAADLLRLRPDYTVASYQSNSVAAMAPSGRLICEGLRAAGIP